MEKEMNMGKKIKLTEEELRDLVLSGTRMALREWEESGYDDAEGMEDEPGMDEDKDTLSIDRDDVEEYISDLPYQTWEVRTAKDMADMYWRAIHPYVNDGRVPEEDFYDTASYIKDECLEMIRSFAMKALPETVEVDVDYTDNNGDMELNDWEFDAYTFEKLGRNAMSIRDQARMDKKRMDPSNVAAWIDDSLLARIPNWAEKLMDLYLKDNYTDRLAQGRGDDEYTDYEDMPSDRDVYDLPGSSRIKDGSEISDEYDGDPDNRYDEGRKASNGKLSLTEGQLRQIVLEGTRFVLGEMRANGSEVVNADLDAAIEEYKGYSPDFNEEDEGWMEDLSYEIPMEVSYHKDEATPDTNDVPGNGPFYHIMSYRFVDGSIPGNLGEGQRSLLFRILKNFIEGHFSDYKQGDDRYLRPAERIRTWGSGRHPQGAF